MSIQQDVQNSWHEAIVELFELDLEPITGDATDKFYFTGDIFPDGTKILWQGERYEPFPIEITGFETTTKGTIPQPELTVANVLGTLAAAVNSLDDLVGAKITRRRTLGKFLDNGRSPDPSEEFPSDIYYIERKISETNLAITWQLASKIDLEGLQLPRRVITQNYCIWKYRGPECSYNGPPVADEKDKPLTGDGSSASQAYINAVKNYNIAESRLNNAQYIFSASQNEATIKCNPNARPIARNYSSLVPPFSFGLVQDGQPLLGVLQGNVVSLGGDNPSYTTPYTINTGYGEDQNKTGPAYAVKAANENFIFSIVPPFSFALRFGPGNLDYFMIFNGTIINTASIGSAYLVGGQRAENFATVTGIGEVDTNTNLCASSQASNATAASDLATATADLQNAKNALDVAAANLSMSSALYSQDVCGKRLNSCKLRFGSKDLPFGGFPGANLT